MLNNTFFIGTVEDINDPLKIGRVKVRCYNIHSISKSDISTEHLPWAIPIQSISSAAQSGVGISPTGIHVGTTVIGFFADTQFQVPMVLGTLAGLPGGTDKQELSDIPPSTKGIFKPKNKLLPKEPDSKFSGTAKYPFNQVFESRAGHMVEFDNTEGKERIHIRHAAGTYIEIQNDGRIVIKGVAKQFNIVKKDKTEWIGGNSSITIEGNCAIDIKGTLDITAKKKITIKSDEKIELKAPRIDENT